MLNKLLYKFHRILGTILSALFLLWFLTGFVMIFHTFPKITDKEKYEGLSTFSIQNISQIDSLVNCVSEDRAFSQFSLKATSDGGFQIEYQADHQFSIIDSSGQSTKKQDFREIEAYARRLNSSAILQIDTVESLDQWVPYIRDYAHFPLYKFYYNDECKSELYVSSQTGEGIQYTNSDSRFWAWVGSIPHWFYIANLRHNSDLWRGLLIVLSGVGSLMCLSGIIIGFRSFYKRYKKKKQFKSAYKSIYKWHHLLGFSFGIFVFTFVFSGMMSLQKVPQWIIRTNNPQLATMSSNNSGSIHLQHYQLNYTDILQKYNGQIKKLEWSIYNSIPYYKAVINDSLLYFDGRSHLLKEFILSEDDIYRQIIKIHPTNNINVELINDYDNYYIDNKRSLPLPVYKITIDDADRSSYYIDPKTAHTIYLNSNMRFRKWTYQALHSFSIKPILDRPILWNILMWTSMIGGTLVSFTGLYLGIRYIKRKIRKIKK